MKRYVVVRKVIRILLQLLLFQVVLISAQVPNVKRNVTDSFQGDSIDCNDEPYVCSERNAMCRQDGTCVCDETAPDYMNPMFIVIDGRLSYATSDGCMSFSSVIDSIDKDNLRCSYSFYPYQIMPNRWTSEPTTFLHPAGASYSDCKYTGALARYPGDKTWKNLTWMNESDVEINMTIPGYLDFKWTRSMPELHGLMIIINLNCHYRVTGQQTAPINNTVSVSRQCLRAKVLGTISSSATPSLYFNNSYFFVVLGLWWKFIPLLIDI